MLENTEITAIVLNTPDRIARITEEAIICADGGFSHVAENVLVYAVVGDMDSVRGLPDYVRTVKYPADKDKTDGELCLDFAKAEGFSSVRIYGAEGGRADHAIGNLGLLSYAKKLGLDALIVTPDSLVRLVTEGINLTLEKGARFSFVPVDDVVVSRLSGTKYTLTDTQIEAFSSRGISNVALGGEVIFEAKGRVLVIHDKA